MIEVVEVVLCIEAGGTGIYTSNIYYARTQQQQHLRNLYGQIRISGLRGAMPLTDYSFVSFTPEWEKSLYGQQSLL